MLGYHVPHDQRQHHWVVQLYQWVKSIEKITGEDKRKRGVSGTTRHQYHQYHHHHPVGLGENQILHID